MVLNTYCTKERIANVNLLNCIIPLNPLLVQLNLIDLQAFFGEHENDIITI